MQVIDLFSGCGGLSLGFVNAGYDVLVAYDNWQPAVNIYKKNFSHPIYQKDLSKLEKEDFEELENFHADLIIGGPPCQDFSSAGKRDESLGRADLTVEYAKIVTTIKPKWFVMENVERALISNAYKNAYQMLSDNNYGLTRIILDASLCGVPQSRKRLFLIGELNGQNNFLEPYLKKNLSKKAMTVRDYFGDKLKIDHYYRHPRSYERRAVFSIDEPSPTIRGVNRPIPPNYSPHDGDTTTIVKTPTLRPLTTHERSQIQTFPEKFDWNDLSKANAEQLIGNAVPVKLSEYVANCLLEYIKDKENNRVIMAGLL
jgi:DNA (cytosine-5)-methyltransferase 1